MDAIAPRFVLQTLCSRNRAHRLFEAIADFDIFAGNLIVVPRSDKVAYLSDRIARLVRILAPVWQFQQISILISGEYQEISLKSLLERYPALLRVSGKFDDARRIERLEQNQYCLEAVLEYLKTKGTLYKIDSSGVYWEAFYRHPNPKIPPEQLIGKTVFQVLPPENQEAAQLILRSVRDCIALTQTLEVDYSIWDRGYHATFIPVRNQNFCYVLVNRTQ